MYPGKRRNDDTNKATKSWSEQDDAFFGPKPTWLSSSSTSSSFSSKSATAASTARNKQPVKKTIPAARKNPNKQMDLIDNQIREAAMKQKERISNIAKKAASRISDFIESSNEVNRRNENNIGTVTTSRNATNSAKMDALKVTSQHETNDQTKSCARKYKKVPEPSDFNVNSLVRTAKNVLLSQLPMPCAYCRSIPMMYKITHFHGQRICSTHDYQTLPKCLSCYKIEPKHAPFDEIGTTGSLLCPACARTAILNNGAARDLFNEILVFFQSFDLCIFHGMKTVPINLVTTQEMNKNFSSFKDSNSSDKYGICCYSEMHSPLGAAVGLIGSAGAAAAKGIHRFVRNQKNKGQLKQSQDQANNNSGTKRNPLGAGRLVFINQIAALKGLPRIYLGQVLAHEATHAWFALNPTRKQGVQGENFQFLGVIRKLPMLVEEGCCQLVAHLYLDSHPYDNLTSDESTLVKFCSWSIEHHSTYEYGEGYKQAARAYNHIIDNGGSLGDLLEYVSIHMAFPPC